METTREEEAKLNGDYMCALQTTTGEIVRASRINEMMHIHIWRERARMGAFHRSTICSLESIMLEKNDVQRKGKTNRGWRNPRHICERNREGCDNGTRRVWCELTNYKVVSFPRFVIKNRKSLEK